MLAGSLVKVPLVAHCRSFRTMSEATLFELTGARNEAQWRKNVDLLELRLVART